MSTATQSPVERRKAGIKALTAALGREETAAFLGDLLSAAGDDDADYAGIPGWNYTEWRKENPQPSFEEIGEGILRLQAEQEA